MSRPFQNSGEKECYITPVRGWVLSRRGEAGCRGHFSVLNGCHSAGTVQRKETSLAWSFKQKLGESGHLLCARRDLPPCSPDNNSVG